MISSEEVNDMAKATWGGDHRPLSPDQRANKGRSYNPRSLEGAGKAVWKRGKRFGQSQDANDPSPAFNPRDHR